MGNRDRVRGSCGTRCYAVQDEELVPSWVRGSEPRGVVSYAQRGGALVMLTDRSPVNCIVVSSPRPPERRIKLLGLCPSWSSPAVPVIRGSATSTVLRRADCVVCGSSTRVSSVGRQIKSIAQCWGDCRKSVCCRRSQGSGGIM